MNLFSPRQSNRSSRLSIIGLFATLVMVINGPGSIAHAADGGLDTTFGSSGSTLVGGNGSISAMAFDSSGRIIAGGYVISGGKNLFTVGRFLANGAVDTSFGTSGFTTVPTQGGTYDVINAIAIDSSGRIFAAGFDSFANNTGYNGVLLRFTSSGALDTGFASSGIMKTNLSAVSQYGGVFDGIALDTSGRIVVGGGTTTGPYKFLLARYSADGVLDTTFGSSGYTVTTPGTDNDQISAIAIDSAGKIYAGGHAYSSGHSLFAIGRYTANGAVDTSYGTSGFNKSTLGTDDNIRSIVIDGSGRAVVGGSTTVGGSSRFILARYTTSGALDTTFGTSGYNSTTPGTNDSFASIALDSYGRILAGGSATLSGVGTPTLARYSPSGTLDTSFGTSGYTSTSIGIGAVIIDSSNKIVLGGSSSGWATARYLNNSPSLGSLCFDGSTKLGVTLPAIDSSSSTNDFTIESWVKVPSSIPSAGPIVGTNGAAWYGTGTGYTLFVNGVPGASNGQIGFNGFSDTSRASNPIPANTWFHVAYVRQSGLGTIYLNGVPQTNATAISDPNHYTNTAFYIGNDTGLGFFKGCLSNLVVANSALYTANFASSLPYPATMSTPTAGLYVNPNSADSLATWNKGTGSVLSAVAGTVTFASDYPIKPLITATPTFTAAAANLNFGQSETLTVTVASGATGSVVFKDAGGNVLCTISSLDGSGSGQCVWTPSVVGTYVVRAYYSGDSGYNSATSSSTSINVTSAITYSVNGATGSAPTASVYSGTAIALPAGTGLSKSGYDFGGWATSESGTAVTSPYSPANSLTLYAVWTPHQYAITFNANGGSGSQSATSYTTGASATALPATTTFTRTGYNFVGWGTTSAATTPVTSYSTSSPIVFYALWTHGTYGVTFLPNGGSGSMAIESSTATANLTANAFTYSNHTFTGWNTSADGTGTPYSNSQSYPFLASITLYAQWGNLITFSSQGAEQGSPSITSQNWSSGSINLATVGTMVKAGYSFSGWSDGSQTYSSGSSYTPTGGITLNPVWSPNTYLISFNSNQASSGTVPVNQSWTTGTSALTLSGNTGSLAKTGYSFGGWAATAGSTSAVTSYSTTAAQTFYAIWTPIAYTVAYSLNGGTGALPTQANQRIYNTFTLATAASKADFSFAGWSDGVSTYSAGASYTISATTPSAVTLTAQWIPRFTISYALNGSSSSVTGAGTYDSGTVITLSSAPLRAGYTFAGWLDSNNISHGAGTSFTVIQNSLLQAQWTAIAYSITFNLGGGSGTLPLQSALTINSTFQVASSPNRDGYLFTGWSDSSTVYAANSTYVVGTSNVVLTAQWSAISYSVGFDLGGGRGTLPTQAPGNIGSTFTLPSSASNPQWVAHTFTGWSDGASLYQPGAAYAFGASNVTFTAQFVLNGYTQITYSLNDGTGIAPVQASVLEGTVITIASGAMVNKANYAFNGWSDGAALYQPGATYLVGPYTSPITFTPSWTSGYNVSYQPGSGFGTPPSDPVGRIPGSTFTVASAASLNRQGFTFTGWSDGTTVYQPSATYTVGSSNITFTAQWVQNSLAGIRAGALTPLGTLSIVTGVGNPSSSFSFGSTTVTYSIPANALSAGTTLSIFGLSDFSTLSGIIPTDKTVISSTVISWLGSDGTVQNTNSPITMTITDSNIVPGSIVYAVSGSSIVTLGVATTSGSITTSISSDPVLVVANPIVAPVVSAPPSNSTSNSSSSAAAAAATQAVADAQALAIAQAAAAKALADKQAADAAAKALADQQAADAAKALATKQAEEAAAKALADQKAAADAAAKALADQQAADAAAKALADQQAQETAAKALADQQAADAAAAKAAKDAADKAAAEAQAAKDAAAAAARVKPAVTLYSLTPKLTLSAYDTAYLQRYVRSLKSGAAVTCVGYIYKKGTTLAKATALAKSQATAVCALMKKINKTLKTSISIVDSSKAPKGAVGAKWVAVSYRIDGFKTRG